MGGRSERRRASTRVRESTRRRTNHDAMVVVRPLCERSGTRAGDAAHEGGGHWWVRNPACLSAGARRSGERIPQLRLSLAGVPQSVALHVGQGAGAWAPDGSDSGQRVAVWWSTYSGHAVGGKAALRARSSAGEHEPRSPPRYGRWRKTDSDVSRPRGRQAVRAHWDRAFDRSRSGDGSDSSGIAGTARRALLRIKQDGPDG